MSHTTLHCMVQENKSTFSHAATFLAFDDLANNMENLVFFVPILKALLIQFRQKLVFSLFLTNFGFYDENYAIESIW